MKLLARLFPVGTRSLLWGVHQFLWHPYTVYRAWVALYGRPSWREAVVHPDPRLGLLGFA